MCQCDFYLTPILQTWMMHNTYRKTQDVKITDTSLKKRPHFREQVIEDVTVAGENYTKKSWEDDLADYCT